MIMLALDMLSKLTAVICISMLLSFVCALPRGVICGPTPKNDQVGLVSKLLDEAVYNPALKPTIDHSKQLQVHVSFVLSRIQELDERTQTLVSFGFLDFRWYDELLTWEPAEYGGIDRLVVKPDMVWLPEVELLNSAEPAEDMPLSVDFRVEVRHDGLMRWSPAMKWTTLCPLDLSFFPFDHQTCEVILFNRMYRSNSVNLTIHSDEVFIPPNIHVPHREWILTDQSLKREDIKFTETITVSKSVETYSYDIPVVRMVLHLQRESMYYLLNILLPTFIVGLISSWVFILPSDSGEKIGFSVTMLLSYFVILLYVSDMMPRTGNVIPYISWYISICMLFNCLGLIVTVFILNIYHHHPFTRVPKIFRVLSFGCCARILCLDAKAHKKKKEPPLKQTISLDTLSKGSSLPDKNANNGHSLESGINCSQSQLSQSSFPSENGSLQQGSSISVDSKMNELEEEDTDGVEELRERNRIEWALFARVTDRLMFILSSMFSICLTTVYFIALNLTSLSLGDI